MSLGYNWVVTCRNTKLHEEQNPCTGHRIPVGRTDETEERPPLPDRLDAVCDDLACRKSYSYGREEVIRWHGDVLPFLPQTLSRFSNSRLSSLPLSLSPIVFSQLPKSSPLRLLIGLSSALCRVRHSQNGREPRLRTSVLPIVAEACRLAFRPSDAHV